MHINYKKVIILHLLVCNVHSLFAKENKIKDKINHSSELWTYWGWNRAHYSKSDLHLKGDNYNIILHKIIAKDRQSPFGYNPYFKIDRITIPQYNFRIGYTFSNKWSFSFGQDHMKYVMQNEQDVKLEGDIINLNTCYDGHYINNNFRIHEDFLTFEHTDGLNYVNIEARKHKIAYKKDILKIPIKIEAVGGFGMGILIPKTNAKLFKNARHDEFHVAGYGAASIIATNLTFFKYFFIQNEYKAGYINMPNIRTTESKSDMAKQHFTFLQININFGLKYSL